MKLLDDREYLDPPESKQNYICKCDICDEKIFEGNEYYKIDNIIYCPECIITHFQIIAENMDVDAYLADLEHEDITK